jgi:pyrimidine-specific ribonucleoside hydrolase
MTATGRTSGGAVHKVSGIPLIIDVDTGTDDAVCLAAATLCDEVNILGFSAVCGNVGIDRTSRNTRDLVEYLGHPAPIYIGASKPLQRSLITATSHGETGLGDVILPRAQRAVEPGAVSDLIVNAAREHAGRLEVLAVGPLTNLATAFTYYPELPSLIKKVTIMGGGIHGGNMTIASEFNIYVDPEAARIVFESGCNLTMVGLDVTLRPKLPDRIFDRIRATRSRHADVTARILDYMRRRKAEDGGDEPNLHDVIALAAVVRPALFRFEDYYIHVETEGAVTRGMTIADFHNVSARPANARVAIGIDVDGFWEWFLELFAVAEKPDARNDLSRSRADPA